MLTSVDACRIPTSCDNNTNFASCFKDTCLKILLHTNEKNTKGKSKLKTGHFTGTVKRMNVLRLANVIIWSEYGEQWVNKHTFHFSSHLGRPSLFSCKDTGGYFNQSLFPELEDGWCVCFLSRAGGGSMRCATRLLIQENLLYNQRAPSSIPIYCLSSLKTCTWAPVLLFMKWISVQPRIRKCPIQHSLIFVSDGIRRDKIYPGCDVKETLESENSAFKLSAKLHSSPSLSVWTLDSDQNS